MLDQEESDLDAARAACAQAGIPPGELTPIRVHSNGVFLHQRSGTVVRVGRGPDAVGRARTSVQVTRWLTGSGYPAVQPAPDIDQPVVLRDGVPVTFWRWVSSGGGPATATGLGYLLRRLHRLPPPPFSLLPFRPLARLVDTLRSDAWLPDPDRRWLLDQAAALQQQLDDAVFALGPTGLVHGDAQLGNVIPAVTGPVLGDWDGATDAPREWDLAPTAAERRFGGTADLLIDLLKAYGADPTHSPGWQTLVSIYELRSVAAHIRRAPSSRPHGDEAALRIESLRTGDRSVRWHAVG